MPIDHVGATRQAGTCRSLAKRQMARLFTQGSITLWRVVEVVQGRMRRGHGTVL